MMFDGFMACITWYYLLWLVTALWVLCLKDYLNVPLLDDCPMCRGSAPCVSGGVS